MLELPSLVILPWGPAPPGAAVRAVRDPESGAALGTVCRLRAPGRAWRAWFAHPALAVREAPDDSLLCTLHRLWSLGAAWEVRDAEDRRLTIFRKLVIWDTLGRALAVLERAREASAGRFLAPGGPELAALAWSDDGLHITFADPVQDNPLFKMALLGGALTLEP